MTVHCLPGKGYDSNVYLVTGSDPLLVDTGTGENTTELLAKVSHVIDPSKIKTIILTHRHFDHVGGANAMARVMGAKVFIHDEDAKVVSNGDGWGTLSNMYRKTLDAVDATPIGEGKAFETGEHRFHVIHTPGHSAGSISLFDKGSQDLISGDTVFVGGVGRWDLPSGDYDQLVTSIRRLLDLDTRNLYPGHGPCGIGDAKEQIAQALENLGEC
jgi:glyoxylase-like metal-dependent hydrolase (beta-lactamase superfamily II)